MKVTEAIEAVGDAALAVLHAAWETGKWAKGHPRTSFLGGAALCTMVSIGSFHAAGDETNTLNAWLHQEQANTLVVQGYQDQQLLHFENLVAQDTKDHQEDKETIDQRSVIAVQAKIINAQDAAQYDADQARRVERTQEFDVIWGIGSGTAGGLSGIVSFIGAFTYWNDRHYRAYRRANH